METPLIGMAAHIPGVDGNNGTGGSGKVVGSHQMMLGNNICVHKYLVPQTSHLG